MFRSKKMISLLLALIMLVGVFAAFPAITYAADENLLINGDFETADMSAWWSRTWGYGVWERAAVSGNYVLKATSSKTNADAGANIGTYYCTQEAVPTIALEKGAEYTMSFDVYRAQGVDSRVYLDVVNNSEVTLYAGPETQGVGNGKWETISASFAATESVNVYLRVICNALNSNETVYVDNIKLIKNTITTETLGENLLNNGDFNSADMNGWWLRTDWNGGVWAKTDGIGVEGTPALSAVSSVAAPGGEHNIGAFYTAEGNESVTALVLEAGATYEFGFDVYRAAGVDSNVYIDINEGGLGSAAASETGKWETCKARFTANSSYAKLRLVANALATGENVYVDNIYVKKVTTGGSSISGVQNNSLCVNGSFENGTGKVADGWEQDTTKWTRVAAEGNVTPYDGEYMMRASVTKTAICIGSPIAVKANTYYTFTGKIFRTDSQGCVYLNLLDSRKADIPGTQIGTDTVGKWATVSFTYYSEKATTIHPRLVIDSTADAAPTGKPIYFDDIRFTEQVWEGNKSFPTGVKINDEDIINKWTLATDSTTANFALTNNALYITSLKSVEGGFTEYVSEPIACPLVNVINGEKVVWSTASSKATDNGISITFTDEGGKYELKVNWTAKEGVGPLEYNQYLTGITEDISVAYPDVVNSNFRINNEGDATLYRFSRSRVNDGSDPYFAKGTMDTALTPNAKIVSSVENGYSPVASILPFQMIDFGGDRGVYFGHYWSFGKILVRTDANNDIAVTTYLSDNERATINRDKGVELEIPGFFLGAYEGDIDEGSNEMKDWYWEYKITRTLYENENEPYIEIGDIAITTDEMAKLFAAWPDIANYVNLLKVDYIWTLPDGTNPRVNAEQEDTWTPDKTRYPDGFNVWDAVKEHAANDGIDADMYLSLYMADTYLATDIATKEGRELQLQALKDRKNSKDNEYGIGYDFWRSDFTLETSFDYDSHEGLLYILDSMMEYDEDFRFEHCSGAGSLKDFTTMERMTFMTTEDTGKPLNHRMSYYANTYMVNPLQLKGDLGLAATTRDYGALNGYGDIIGRDEEGKLIPGYKDEDYVTYTFRTAMLGAIMVCYKVEAFQYGNNEQIIRSHYDLYNNTHREMLRNCNVYHILEAPTGWEWNDWDGIMLYNENIDLGAVQLFKENASAPTSKTIKLKGLEADTLYDLTFLDRTEQNCTKTGAELMTAGLTVTGMDTRYDSEIIYIEPFNKEPEEVKVEEIALVGDDRMVVGDTQQLTVEVLPEEADNKAVEWSSSDAAVVAVDANGVVTAKAKGNAVITATAADGSGVEGTFTIYVDRLFAAPTNVKAVSQNYNTLKVSWAAVEGAEGYRVYRADSENGEYTLIYTAAASKLSVNNLNRVTGKPYYYKVAAIAEKNGEVYEGDLSAAKVGKAVPKRPAGVKTSSVSATTIKVSWDAVAGAKGYKLYASATGKDGSFYLSYTTNDPNKTSVNVLKRTTGKTYYFKVRAISEYEGATVSGTLSAAVTGKAVPATPVVTISKATDISNVSIRNKWKAVYGADGYEVYRSLTGKAGTFYLQKRTENLSYANTKLKAGQTYYYKVRAYKLVDNKRVYGNFSTVKSYTL